MLINEIFCSINGESKFSGYRTVFIRTYGCNLRCAWCDSAYSWQGNEFTEMSVEEIIEEVKKYDCMRVTYTGGEPLLQHDAIELIKALTLLGYEVEVETNGAVSVAPVLDLGFDTVLITMDWKCPSSGETSKMLADNLFILRPGDVVKCVVGSREDLDEVTRINGLTDATVYLSPVFGQIELKDLANYILDNGLNETRLQLQQHKFIWPADMRGV